MPLKPDLGNVNMPFRTLGAAFADYEALHPEKLAIHSIDQGIALTFSDLRDIVDRTATQMMATGIKRGDRIAVLCGECVEKLIIMFAAWRCGASACPFHAEIGTDHLVSILRTISPALILWRTGDLDGEILTGPLAAQSFSFTSLDETEGFFFDLPRRAGQLPETGSEYGPDDEGCIFATSGTTDTPKCVVWDQLGLWLCGLSTIKFTGMTADDRLLEYRTFSWLSPQIVTFMPFVALGLTIVIAKSFSRRRFMGWVRDHQITIAAGVPTVINILLDEPVEFHQDEISSLRLMTASSAPLAPERWRQFEAFYGIRLLQFYGASEGGWLCGNRHDKFRIGTAGPPAEHMDLAILDFEGKLCAAGIEGEISMRGPQTAVATITAGGEWEDRTAFRLKERTRVGDLGVMDNDGFVTVTGRVKDVILRGGVSISPLEIDAAIMSNPNVHEAAAVGVPDPIWGEEIVCYVVLAEGKDTSTEQIQSHATEVLPAFKHPRYIRLVSELPKNDRGKVQRENLKRLWSKTTPTPRS
ncbi:MAG: class I adenylate-forming enzyme family protein [Pseudomonadota bacterium]|nr:class I adenylate-forming enzyme family protein [Pseudomonadota bacterium]